MKWMVCILIVLIVGCTTGQLLDTQQLLDGVNDPNVLGPLVDVNSAEAVGELVTTVGTLVGNVKLVLLGGIIASGVLIVNAFKKRKK